MIPVSIVGAHKFYDTLTNFLGLIGYWASAFGAIVLVEHLVIRRGDFSTYDIRYWNNYRRLPTGLAALGACLLACALIVPSMDQVWFVGPIAQKTGDIGFELAFVTAGLFYVPLRYLELRFRPLVSSVFAVTGLCNHAYAFGAQFRRATTPLAMYLAAHCRHHAARTELHGHRGTLEPGRQPR